MTPMKITKISNSLKKKGFHEDNGDHRYYTLYYDGKKTGVYTKVSHGKSHGTEVGEPLISTMARQVHLSKADFQDLINCPLSKEQYIGMMLSEGIVK